MSGRRVMGQETRRPLASVGRCREGEGAEERGEGDRAEDISTLMGVGGVRTQLMGGSSRTEPKPRKAAGAPAPGLPRHSFRRRTLRPPRAARVLVPTRSRIPTLSPFPANPCGSQPGSGTQHGPSLLFSSILSKGNGRLMMQQQQPPNNHGQQDRRRAAEKQNPPGGCARLQDLLNFVVHRTIYNYQSKHQPKQEHNAYIKQEPPHARDDPALCMEWGLRFGSRSAERCF